ncbi:hypothetical protein L1987_65135 [Smallanthus sonchifolius]|uniref:Uncharacterized protein n=1 Tax=Smallanthus sonchifolius TaxID=185202 RepID=A0ACB9BTU5_9ASTR|nr:hypothetical protein L1987_65135 [Smallanthus sonchifolius]
MVKLLSNLKEIHISNCDGMEEVVSNRDDEDKNEDKEMETLTTTLFPHLDILMLWHMNNLKQIGGAGVDSKSHGQSKCSEVDVVSWYLCQYPREIRIAYYAAGRMERLQVLSIAYCTSMIEVFETKEINDNNISDCSSIIDTISRSTDIAMHKFPNLKILKIDECELLENIFTFSILESLNKLETLTISRCKAMKVIVREEHGEQMTTSSKDVVLPHLKSIELDRLPNLADTIPSLDGISSQPTISEGRTWTFHNLIECDLGEYIYDEKKIFPFNELKQMQKLETINAKHTSYVEEVFEIATEVTNNESQTVVKFPKLREVEFDNLPRLKHIWKSNPWRILEFPNLTRVSIVECGSLEHVFTYSMVGCVMKLRELHIAKCKNMKAIVKEEEHCDADVSDIKFPCLKSLKLETLLVIEGFFLWKEDLLLPSLNTLLKAMPKNNGFQRGACSCSKANRRRDKFWLL